VKPDRMASWKKAKPGGSIGERRLVLVLACIIPLGSHFIRKALGPLKTAMLADPELNLDNTKFAMLLSATSLPNLLVPIFGGALLDMRGSRYGTLLFVLITLIGQICFTISAHFRVFSGLLASQILIGIGAGSTVVSQAAISSEYFQGTEIGFAIGIMESAHNLSNWMGQAIPAQVVAYFGGKFLAGLWAGVFCCFISLIAAIVYALVDSRCKKKDTGPCSQKSLFFESLSLPQVFFALALFHMLFSTAHQSFDNISANLLTVRFGDNAVKAGLLASIDNAMGLLMAPLMGQILDCFGRRLQFAMGMALLVMIGQLWLALAVTSNPLLPLILLGISNSSVPTILRSSVPLVVNPSGWGTAFGIFEAFEAMGTFSGNLAAGMLKDLTSSYVLVNLTFALFGLVCFLIALVMVNKGSEEARALAFPLDHSSGVCCADEAKMEQKNSLKSSPETRLKDRSSSKKGAHSMPESNGNGSSRREFNGVLAGVKQISSYGSFGSLEEGLPGH